MPDFKISTFLGLQLLHQKVNLAVAKLTVIRNHSLQINADKPVILYWGEHFQEIMITIKPVVSK